MDSSVNDISVSQNTSNEDSRNINDKKGKREGNSRSNNKYRNKDESSNNDFSSDNNSQRRNRNSSENQDVKSSSPSFNRKNNPRGNNSRFILASPSLENEEIKVFNIFRFLTF